MDEARRRDKLDDALLFLTASVGILFSILQAFLRPSTLPQFIIPVGFLALLLPFYYGYLKGAIGDSMVDRYRGWTFLVIGSGLYSIIIVQEELTLLLSPNPIDSGQAGILTAPFVVLLYILLRQTERLRKFVLGPKVTMNPVFSRTMRYTMRAAFVIVIASSFLSIVSFELVLDLAVIGPLIPFAVYFLWKSDFYATRVYWHASPTEKKGHLQKFPNVRLLYRALRIATFVVFGAGGAISIPFNLHFSIPSVSRQFLQGLALVLLGEAGILALPTLILHFLTRTVKDFAFDVPPQEEAAVEEDI